MAEGSNDGDEGAGEELPHQEEERSQQEEKDFHLSD